MWPFTKSKLQKQVDFILNTMSLFFTVSTLLKPYNTLDTNQKAQIGTILYFLGALDYLCQQTKMTENEFGELIGAFFRSTEIPKEDWFKVIEELFCPEDKDDFTLKVLISGAKGINSFIHGEDSTGADYMLCKPIWEFEKEVVK